MAARGVVFLDFLRVTVKLSEEPSELEDERHESSIEGNVRVTETFFEDIVAVVVCGVLCCVVFVFWFEDWAMAMGLKSIAERTP